MKKKTDTTTANEQILQSFLNDEVFYPVTKDELIELAHDVDLEKSVIDILDSLPDLEFDDPDDVLDVVNYPHHHQGGRHI